MQEWEHEEVHSGPLSLSLSLSLELLFLSPGENFTYKGQEKHEVRTRLARDFHAHSRAEGGMVKGKRRFLKGRGGRDSNPASTAHRHTNAQHCIPNPAFSLPLASSDAKSASARPRCIVHAIGLSSVRLDDLVLRKKFLLKKNCSGGQDSEHFYRVAKTARLSTWHWC